MHFVYFFFFSTLTVLWLFTKAPLWLYSEQHQEHPERRGGGWVGGGVVGIGWGVGLGVFRLTGSSLSSTAPHVLLPDLTPVTSCTVKSRDSGPTRARSHFPWPALSWQGLGGALFLPSSPQIFIYFLGRGVGWGWAGKGCWISACGS